MPHAAVGAGVSNAVAEDVVAEMAATVMEEDATTVATMATVAIKADTMEAEVVTAAAMATTLGATALLREEEDVDVVASPRARSVASTATTRSGATRGSTTRSSPKPPTDLPTTPTPATTGIPVIRTGTSTQAPPTT